MSDLPELPATPLGLYRHYRGGEYEVIGAARHSETLEPLVVYRPLYNASGLWVRPHAMFFEHVEFGGRLQPRFAAVATPSRASSGCCRPSMSSPGVSSSLTTSPASPCAISQHGGDFEIRSWHVDL